MAELDLITLSTRRFIKNAKNKILDNIYQNDPVFAYMRDTLKIDFTGGRLIQENFLYDVPTGGPYSPGGSFNITQKNTKQGIQIVPKFYYSNITLYKEDIQVFNNGSDEAIFSIVKAATEEAYTWIGAQLSIGLYLDGQQAGYTQNINGLAEALNDGTTAGYNGVAYPTYGTITRGGVVGSALNTTPQNVGGTLEIPRLEEEYGNATFGDKEPNVIATTVLGFSYLKEKLFGLQRYTETTDIKAGITGLKFNGANILRSRYVPGSAISGAALSVANSDPAVANFMQSLTGVANQAYPTLTGETLWIMNARNPYLNMYISSDPEFRFGFTGFKPAQDNTTIVGQILFSGNVTVPGPRYHRQLFGITG
jgi:hypothetical protein